MWGGYRGWVSAAWHSMGTRRWRAAARSEGGGSREAWGPGRGTRDAGRGGGAQEVATGDTPKLAKKSAPDTGSAWCSRVQGREGSRHHNNLDFWHNGKNGKSTATRPRKGNPTLFMVRFPAAPHPCHRGASPTLALALPEEARETPAGIVGVESRAGGAGGFTPLPLPLPSLLPLASSPRPARAVLGVPTLLLLPPPPVELRVRGAGLVGGLESAHEPHSSSLPRALPPPLPPLLLPLLL